ncbi:MAG: helix-turn-helix domain-containing protein, partial [Trueperaceae bacterium]
MSDARHDPDPTGPRADGLGALLQEGRERSGMDLADVASRTHVRRAYLEALEADDVDALPEDVYARNFVRLFARAVGVDVDEALARFSTLRAPIDPYATGERAPDRTSERGARRETRSTAAASPSAAGVAAEASAEEAGAAPDEGPPNVLRETPPPDFRPKRSFPAIPRPRTAGPRGPIDARARRSRREAGAALPGVVLLRQAAPLLLTLALAGVLVGATVWGFNQLLFSGSTPTTGAGDPEPATGPEVAGRANGGAAGPAVPGGAVVPD